MFTVYSKAELITDAVIHAIGVVAGVTAMVSLLWVISHQDDVVIYFACAVYGLGLVAMLGLSAAYHFVSHRPVKAILRRLDHAAIFVMIAGSYTPFALVKLPESWGILLFAVVWTIALLGIVLKLRYPRRFERLSIALYLLQGWIIVIAIGPLVDTIPLSGLILMGTGGLLYTIGVIFHISERLPFHNAIWHGLVLTAAACHYVVVMQDVALAAVAL